MEQDKLAQRGQGTFLDTAIMDLNEMKVAAKMILDSKLAPDHFYEKTPDNKPDYTKGKVESVILVCVHGHDLGLKPLVALQHIIPVNGLLSIKGDAAKTLIFNSGKLRPGSWKETVTGSLANGDYECTMTAERLDTKEVMSRTFGIEHAKRAGLWIDDAKIKGQDGWKYLKSAWYKYPERMMAYRALGFLSRDLFPDVLSGSYTTEEAIDMPVDTSLVVQTTGGAEVIIPDTEFNKGRSGNLTKKATDQIDKRSEQYPSTIGDAYPVKKEEAPPIEPAVKPEPAGGTERQSIATMLNGTPGFISVYTEEELREMESSSELNPMVECDSLMVKIRDIDPGKNTNKKLRTILLAHYAGESIQLYAKFDPEDKVPMSEVPPQQPIENEEPPPEPENQPEYEAVMENEAAEDPPPADNTPIEPNTGFDASAPDPVVTEGTEVNKFEVEIPELVEGKRSFDQVKTLFEELANKAGVDNNAYDSMVKSKFPQFQKYRSKEDFCYMGEVSEINTLLNSI